LNTDDCFGDGLLKRIRPDKEAAKREVEKAKEYLIKAQKNEEIHIHDIAVVAAYTSMFHAARAILLRDGIKERSHICIVIYLREKYPELKHQTRILDTYRRFRHTALYALDVTIDDKEAKKSIELAREFIEVMRKSL
jgi:uncharacterized protein (UPF0332 family)